MSISEKQKHELKKFIKELGTYRGSHTELVSVYIPHGYDIIKIINHLDQEKGTATNIKSASTRKNVIDSLEKMTQHLRLFKRTPENGLAVFSGNVAERKGQQDFKVWSIEPPVPLNTRIYRCDKEFQLDLIRDMMDSKEVYGLVIIDRRDAIIAHLKGKVIIPLLKTHSEVPGKTKAGGQCCIFSTTIQSANGDIFEIKNCHNPHQVSSMIMSNYSIKKSPIIDKWITQKNEVYKIKTKKPQLVVECSKDHLFFVMTNKGLIQKPAEELKIDEQLIMPEQLNIKGEIQYFNPKKYYNSFIINKKGQELLKKKREEKGIFQKILAKRLGLQQMIISSYETGKRNASLNPLKKLCIELNIDFENFIKKYTKEKLHQGSNIKLPQELNKEFAQFIGYFIGDGCAEKDRITFFEQRKEVALKYKNIFDNLLGLNSSYKFRESKNYHQLKFTSRPLVRLIKGELPEIKKALDSKIPKKILQSPPEIVASFLKGLFDAEGYNGTIIVGIGSNNKILIKQIQLLLLRFSILASFSESDNKHNPYSDNPIYKIIISEKKSLEIFRGKIGFTSTEKQNKLNKIIKNKSNTSYVRQILYPGKEIRKIIEKTGYNLELFPKVSSFFNNKRMMSKQAFKRSILNYIKDKKLYKKLEEIYNIPILPVKISKIDVTKKTMKMVDISVKNQSFIADGIITHNSSARFERLREGAKKDHFKKVAEYMKEKFLSDKNLKGIIVGGPGPTKYDFLDRGYVTADVKNKVIAIKDLSYTGEFGLQELLEKSQDVLADEEVIDEKKIVGKFFELLSTKQGMVSYGIEEVMKKLKMGVVETLLLSESLGDEKIEEFENEAKTVGSEVKIISIETREGAQLKDIGKIAAILRYEA